MERGIVGSWIIGPMSVALFTLSRIHRFQSCPGDQACYLPISRTRSARSDGRRAPSSRGLSYRAHGATSGERNRALRRSRLFLRLVSYLSSGLSRRLLVLACSTLGDAISVTASSSQSRRETFSAAFAPDQQDRLRVYRLDASKNAPQRVVGHRLRLLPTPRVVGMQHHRRRSDTECWTLGRGIGSEPLPFQGSNGDSPRNCQGY